jgi:hypothetical protein
MPPKLSADADYVAKGHEAHVAQARLLPLINHTSHQTGDPVLTRWDGMRGTPQELLGDMLLHVRDAVQASGFVPMGTHKGVKYEYSPTRTDKGFGNRYFRLSGELAIPPNLYVAALMHPTEVGACDATLRMNRVLKDFQDNKTRLFHLIAETGPRPLFADRDDCALSSYHEDQANGTWWQFSTSCPSHVASYSNTIRLWTMYWGYKLEPFTASNGKTHTRFTLVSQTELNGYLPKFLVNRMVPPVLSDYVRTLEGRMLAKLEAGLPAKTLLESFGM